MAFAPFDGVLLDDLREPIPGALAVLLHLRVEKDLAGIEKRPRLAREAILDRAKACRELLRQGLSPEQLRGLSEFGLRLGHPGNARSLASLLSHFKTYLSAVHEAGFLEPFRALWDAVEVRNSGGRGFWVERGPEDGPFMAGIEDLAPPRLRALMAIPELGTVRFQLAVERGSGACGLFDRKAPHLVDRLLPTLESAASNLGHFEMQAPSGWAENPWGPALDLLFEGPLALDEATKSVFQRGLLPSPFAVLRAAVEQVRGWVEEGIAASDIALIHPDPAAVSEFLNGLLEAEGLGLARMEGRNLNQVRPWTSLVSLFDGLINEDPQALAEGLRAVDGDGGAPQAWRELAEALGTLDQTGREALSSVVLLPRFAERWSNLLALQTRRQSPKSWAGTIVRLARSLGLVPSGDAFYGASGLLEEAWAQERGSWTLGEMFEALRCFLEVGTEAPRPGHGVSLLSPAALLRGWEGARATLLLDQGEGVWPAQSHPPADLDWERRAAINAALRAASQGGDFPPALQAFWLPRVEDDERLPRAFHHDAFGFNTALALTRERLVALTSATDAEGNGRSQGVFWKALEGVGDWNPDAVQSRSNLRHAWDFATATALETERQVTLKVQDPSTFPALNTPAVPGDLMPDWWTEGSTQERPLSPTRLESLARCPFRVFAERGLGLSSWAKGQRTALDLGTVAHHLMQRMLEGLDGAAHWPDAFKSLHGLQNTKAWTLETILLHRWSEDESLIFSSLRDAPSARDLARLRLAIEGLLPGLAESLAWDLAQEVPTKDEIERLDIQGDGPWRRQIIGLEYAIPAQDVSAELGLDGPLWIRGKVDRLERWECGEQVFMRVIDYKTTSRGNLVGYSEAGGLLGPHLQLPLYQWLLECQGGPPVSALLWPLRNGDKPMPAMFAIKDVESRNALKSNLKRLVERARDGVFPAVPGEHCGTCALSSLCGRPVDLEAVEESEEDA